MEVTEEKKLSLWALQDAMLQAEEEINSDVNIDELIGHIAGKIDAIKEVIDLFDSEAERFAGYAKDMAAKKKSAENAADRLRKYVMESLVAHDTTFEAGNIWKVQLTASEKVVIHNDPTFIDLIDFDQLPVIKTSYSWDKKEVKKLLESGNEQVKKIAKIEKTNSVKFTANTRVKK